MTSTKAPTSKTKTNTLKEQTEALAAERVEELAQAEARRDALLGKRDSWAEQEATILADWARGDDTHDADTLKDVRGELERAGVLLTASERAVRQAGRRLINTDDTLAMMLVPAIKSAYAVPVTTATVEPTEPPTDLPQLVIVQLEPTSHRLDMGSMNGTVELRYYRTDAHAPLTADRLTAHLLAADIQAEVGQQYSRVLTTPIPGGQLDSERVQVFKAFPQTPKIMSPGSVDNVKSFGSLMALRMEQSYVTYSNTGAAAYPQKVSCFGPATKDRVDRKDETTITVTFDLDYGKIGWLKADMAEKIPTYLNGLVGTSHSGLGRLESFMLGANKSVMNSFSQPVGTATTVEATFVSRRP